MGEQYLTQKHWNCDGCGTGHRDLPQCPLLCLAQRPPGMDVIGIDPNDSMEPFAQRSAAKAGFTDQLHGHKLRFVKGVVSTATLCSVSDAARAISEIRRVLKPGGCFLFVEHVLSQTSPDLVEKQCQAAAMLR